MSARAGLVYLVDDEPEMVKAIARLLRAWRFEVRRFTSARAFLDAGRPEEGACLVLDVAMPEIDGLELQRHLAREGVALPIIFLTGQADSPKGARALEEGAVAFLAKPVDATVLIDAVRAALRSGAP